MPPKNAKAADKGKMAQKQKTVEDKTFGLKNKNKSSKVQKYVEQLQKSAQPTKNPRTEEASRKDKKKQEEERQKELNALFAMAIKQPKVPVGVDPKSVVCEYFRHGQCTKGFKCKFSHDLAVERKGPKLDLYADKRDDEKDEGMDDWDQEMLEKAIAQKHALENKNRPTEIVCKYFIDAVEKRQYGWFWQCPNGKDCKYRHALPPGYVLKSEMKALLEEEAANSKTVEEIIEEERAKVDAKTPITEEVFKRWKAEQEAAKEAVAKEKEEERRRKGILTGREIFAEEGFVATDDVSASAEFSRDRDEEAEIRKMHAAAAAAALEAARTAGGEAPAAEAAADGASGSAAPAAVQLTAAEEEELFDDDDDDVDLDELAAEVSQLKT